MVLVALHGAPQFTEDHLGRGCSHTGRESPDDTEFRTDSVLEVQIASTDGLLVIWARPPSLHFRTLAEMTVQQFRFLAVIPVLIDLSDILEHCFTFFDGYRCLGPGHGPQVWHCENIR